MRAAAIDVAFGAATSTGPAAREGTRTCRIETAMKTQHLDEDRFAYCGGGFA